MSTLRARRSINASKCLRHRYYATSGYPINPESTWLYRSESSIAEARTRAREVKDVAILGGGITGLASAFYLSKQLPEARITILEGSSRLGGWLHSQRVDVGNGNVVFEQGPRTLRPNVPNGLVTLNLVCVIIVLLFSLSMLTSYYHRSNSLDLKISYFLHRKIRLRHRTDMSTIRIILCECLDQG